MLAKTRTSSAVKMAIGMVILGLSMVTKLSERPKTERPKAERPKTESPKTERSRVT